MIIQNGLFHNSTICCDASGHNSTYIYGICSYSGPVSIRITENDIPLEQFNSKEVGIAEKKAFEFTIADIPEGGPYDITLSVGEKEHVTCCNVMVIRSTQTIHNELEPIVLKKAKFFYPIRNSTNPLYRIELTYGNVIGFLSSSSDTVMQDFCLFDSTLQPIPVVDMTIDTDTVSLFFQHKNIGNINFLFVFYDCPKWENIIHDQNNSKIPFMDYIPVEIHVFSPYLNVIHHSKPFNCNSLENLSLPDKDAIIFFPFYSFQDKFSFSELPGLSNTASQTIYFLIPLVAPYDMDVNLHLTHAFSIKAWTKDTLVFQKNYLDHTLHNDIIPLHMEKGTNKFTFALLSSESISDSLWNSIGLLQIRVESAVADDHGDVIFPRICRSEYLETLASLKWKNNPK